MSEDTAIIGMFIVGAVLAYVGYFVWRLMRPTIQILDSDAHIDQKIDVLRDIELDAIAKEKGIDINAELAKRQEERDFWTRGKVKKMMEQRMIDHYFPKKKKA